LQQLHDQLEAALVPLNRDALHRVLARLAREAQRESQRAGENAPDRAELERELASMIQGMDEVVYPD